MGAQMGIQIAQNSAQKTPLTLPQNAREEGTKIAKKEESLREVLGKS